MYNFIKKHNTLLSVFILVCFLSYYSGNEAYLQEASAYSSATSSLDHRYFSKFNREQEYQNTHEALRQKLKIKNKIFDVISSYSTGLDAASLNMIPRL